MKVNSRLSPLKHMNAKVCQIFGDTVGVTASGDVFAACNECAFPVCRPCYEYERKEENQPCPQCKTRYKRHKGSARVEGDDEEDGVDDLENEFNYVNGNGKSKQHWKMHGQGKNVDMSSSISDSQHPIPLLINGHPVSGELPDATPDLRSMASPTTSGPLGSGEKRVHSLPHIDPSLPVPVRPVDPSKDLESYGLEKVDWKERIENWKVKQEKNPLQMTSGYPDGKGDMEGTGSNSEELQIFKCLLS